jgi:putative tryptophan/tyrosine transport system permease protein
MTMLQIIDSSILLGLIYCGVAISIAISLRILDFPDLTIEGSVPLGGAITAVAIQQGVNPVIAILFAMMIGAGAGASTAIFHTKLKINKLLAGIIALTILYSLNLRVMGSSNIGLLNHETIFSWVENLDNAVRVYIGWSMVLHPLKALTLLAFVIFISYMIIIFLKTEIGLRLRSVGDNIKFAQSVGVNPSLYIIVGLALANGIASVCGGIIAMNQGFTDVGMGHGMLVLGLASLILGEKVLYKFYPVLGRVKYLIIAAVLGSILYQGILVVALKLGLPPTDLKLGTAIIVLIAVALQYCSKIVYSGQRYEY